MHSNKYKHPCYWFINLWNTYKNFRNLREQKYFYSVKPMSVMEYLKAGQNAKFPWNMVKNCVKNVIFLQIFQKSLEEKYKNIHLYDNFPLKIAKFPSRRQNFLGTRWPNSTFFPLTFSDFLQVGLYLPDTTFAFIRRPVPHPPLGALPVHGNPVTMLLLVPLTHWCDLLLPCCDLDGLDLGAVVQW